MGIANPLGLSYFVKIVLSAMRNIAVRTPTFVVYTLRGPFDSEK